MHKVIIRTIIFSLLLTVLPTPRIVHAGTLSRPPSNLGLVGYWPMDEGVGNKTGDASGSGNTGTITSATWTNGKYGKALYFNGTASVNTNYDLSWNHTNSVSISFWLKPDNITDIRTGIMGKNFGGYEWGFYQENAAVKLVYWDNTGNHTNGMDSGWGNVLEVGKWINLTYTWDGSTSFFYANGALVNTRVSTNPSLNMNRTNSVMIGGNIYIWGDKYFKGILDDVRAYTRALSPTEISRMYSSGTAIRKGVSNSGLVGYWSMNEGRGTNVGDSSGQGNTGTISGATWTNGIRGKALSFNGINSYVDVNLINSGLTGSQTISAWMKSNGPPSGKPHQTVLATDNTYLYGVKLMTYKNINRVGLWVGNGSSAYEAFVNANVNDGKWHFVSGVYDYNAGIVTIFIDGVAYSPINSGQITVNISTLGKIGRDYHNSDYSYNGLIDDVRIYNRALSAGEIQNLYKQSSATIGTSYEDRLTNGLVGNWTFNGKDISGTTVFDKSGQGNNGTINGAKPTIGKLGQALEFNGSSTYVNLTNNDNLKLSSGTVSAWIKTSNAGTGFRSIVSKPQSYQMYLYNNIFGIYDPVAGAFRSSGVNLANGEWNHVLFIFNSGVSNGTFLYINGEHVLTTTTTNNHQNSSLYVSFGQGGLNQIFNGSIDEVRVYDRALSAEEIKQLYNMGK